MLKTILLAAIMSGLTATAPPAQIEKLKTTHLA